MRRPLRSAPLFAVCLAFAVAPVAGQEASLRVMNPQRMWQSAQGTIEEAALSVRPLGTHVEYGLYLTFSARDGGFASSEQLEVEYWFELPEGAVVTDSWLWVGDDIVRAEIMDAWTASSIYEDIVDRQRDPSILFKRGPSRYELRVYPMLPDETRRVKLTYLVPARWSSEAVVADLPTGLLRASRAPVDLDLLVFSETPSHPEGTWGLPKVAGPGGLSLEPRSVQNVGAHFFGTLPEEAIWDPAALRFEAPLLDGVYVTRHGDDDGGTYGLVVVPAAMLQASTPRKVALLVDYDQAKTQTSQTELLAEARRVLEETYAPADSFNVILSTLDLRRASETWLPADSASIAAAFEALGSEPLSGYSNLPAVLDAGAGFVRAQGGEGSLLLLASSDAHGEATTANRLIDDLRSRGAFPTTHVIDLATRNTTGHRIGGRWFEGNEYLYLNLTKLTGGTFRDLRQGGTLPVALREVLLDAGGQIASFDLYTTLAYGFTYGRLTSTPFDEALGLGEPVIQVGKFAGTPPFVLEASGLLDGRPFTKRVRLEAPALTSTDSTLESFWVGGQIAALEAQEETNARITQIVDYSLRYRVLSEYTAFLALEPEQGGEICNGCVDETDGSQSTDVEEEIPMGRATLTAYPNPFRDRVTVDVELGEPLPGGALTLAIFDGMGRVVRHLAAPAGIVDAFTVEWDGTNDAGTPVASGTYFFVLTTPTGRHAIALVLVR